MIPPSDLLPRATHYTHFVNEPDAAPGDTFSVQYEGRVPVSAARATLLEGHVHPVSAVPEPGSGVASDAEPGAAVEGRGVAFDGGLRIDAGGFTESEYHLPSRPVTVTLGWNATPASSAVAGMRYNAKLRVPDAQRRFTAHGAGRKLGTFTTEIPAEAGHVELFAHAELPDAIERLSAVSACTVRHYRVLSSLGNGLSVYENPDAVPRAFTVEKVRSVADLDEARATLRDDETFDATHAALVQEAPRVARFGPGAVLRSTFDDERVEIVVRTSDLPTFLVVNDRFHPRWHATVDGMDTPVLRTNGLVRGVVVPGGAGKEHVVVMTFGASPGMKLGAALAFLGVILCVLLGTRTLRKTDLIET